ncbi:hypothetical protein QC334_33970 [Streptomyces sp. DH18]|uniref:hypothetical protein n=1 Tax=Streptomyces sp. DH18 TaxID=3040126 RepID=UPI002442909A|nr:hypothetical protein [Streptomyces sp. DH18]MDG9687679.1 hypothetical protein [Streptomyces sp. DH18]
MERTPEHHSPGHRTGVSCVLEEFDVPTYETMRRFAADLDRLTPEQQRRFRQIIAAFVDDLRNGQSFRASLRIERVRCAPGICELTWSMGTGPAGRATWEHGLERRVGTPHRAQSRRGRCPVWPVRVRCVVQDSVQAGEEPVQYRAAGILHEDLRGGRRLS